MPRRKSPARREAELALSAAKRRRRTARTELRRFEAEVVALEKVVGELRRLELGGNGHRPAATVPIAPVVRDSGRRSEALERLRHYAANVGTFTRRAAAESCQLSRPTVTYWLEVLKAAGEVEAAGMVSDTPAAPPSVLFRWTGEAI